MRSALAGQAGWMESSVMAGTGLSLKDGMAQMSEVSFLFSINVANSVFSPIVGAAPGAFASLRVPLADDTGLSFGAALSENQGLTEHLRTPFRNSAETASLRLDHEAGETRFTLELGDVLEMGGFMGSLAAGGLNMAERASTIWTTATAETALNAHWSLKGTFTLAATGAAHPESSLITAIRPVYATSFALGLAGENLFRPGDALSFTLGQLLRAEQGSLTLVSGTGRDWTTGGVLMGVTKASLLPSGREFDVETGYRFSFVGWVAQANVAYAIDPRPCKQDRGRRPVHNSSRSRFVALRDVQSGGASPSTRGPGTTASGETGPSRRPPGRAIPDPHSGRSKFR